jgi:hypothetical protein
LEFVKDQHGSQERKYTGEPYWTHVVAVAEQVFPVAPETVEAAFCHDLIEDTDCTPGLLFVFLLGAGYDRSDARCITDWVIELTDVYVKSDFPELNRKKTESSRG